MSRIRIVKGKITEKIGGEYNIYSKSNIIYNAVEEVLNKGENEGISYGSPSDPPLQEIRPKCLVKFRPHDKYKNNPNFGFDWLREGDSGQNGDNWFGRIMGKYYKQDSNEVLDNLNGWNDNFKKDLGMYDKKLRSYTNLSISWKSKKNKPYLYPVPILTLLKDRTATFNLKIEIQQRPKKLTFEFRSPKAKEYFKLNIEEIGDIRDGKYDKYNYFKITCIKEFSTMQTLYVKADGEICGAMKIHPNSSTFRKNLNVAFVNVSTNITGEPIVGEPAMGGKDFFIKCCNQALLIPNLVEERIPLDCTHNTFKRNFAPNNSRLITNTSGMITYLEERLERQFGNKYEGYKVLYFIGDQSDRLNGFTGYGINTCVQFAGHNKATIAHEPMHSLCLPHTFVGITRGCGKPYYTYEAKKTNNLMDYSHQDGIERFSLFHWQWKVLNNKINVK